MVKLESSDHTEIWFSDKVVRWKQRITLMDWKSRIRMNKWNVDWLVDEFWKSEFERPTKAAATVVHIQTWEQKAKYSIASLRSLGWLAAQNSLVTPDGCKSARRQKPILILGGMTPGANSQMGTVPRVRHARRTRLILHRKGYHFGNVIYFPFGKWSNQWHISSGVIIRLCSKGT